jgi:hypothetical protein
MGAAEKRSQSQYSVRMPLKIMFLQKEDECQKDFAKLSAPRVQVMLAKAKAEVEVEVVVRVGNK